MLHDGNATLIPVLPNIVLCSPPCRYVYGEDSEPFIFSFFQDVSQNPAVIKAMLAVNHTVQKATTTLNK